MKRIVLCRVLLCVVWMCVTLTAIAQTHDLSQDEIEAFKIQCQERIDAFQMGLEIIADKSQPADIKQHYIRNAIPPMFMGAGDEWTDLAGQRHPAVKMQVSKIRYNNVIEVNDVPLKQYLQNLRNLKWSSVKITKAQTCRISNFYKRSDNLYEATATFFQYFEGRSGENVVYRDKTQKEVKVYLSRVEDGQLGSYWDLKFGDINVAETLKM